MKGIESWVVCIIGTECGGVVAVWYTVGVRPLRMFRYSFWRYLQFTLGVDRTVHRRYPSLGRYVRLGLVLLVEHTDDGRWGVRVLW